MTIYNSREKKNPTVRKKIENYISTYPSTYIIIAQGSPTFFLFLFEGHVMIAKSS